MSPLDQGVDFTRVVFGQHAVHVPAWMVVQDEGHGAVSFVGASRFDPKPGYPTHPLRFESDRTHQLVIGEVIVRPHRVTASDKRQGSGLSGLATDPFTDLADAERIIG